jgi:outer membrane lipase/esterase
MISMLRRLAGLSALATAFFASAPASATYSSMFVFGDSLSDTGNVFIATGGATPGAPYFDGRFSNGPVWIDGLAAGLAMPLGAVPSLAGGNNYAFGGARTGTTTSPVPGLLAQIGGLWAPTHPAADPNALYVVVGGGNDMRDARAAFIGNTAADVAGRQAAAAQAANNILNSVLFLASAGARHIMISTLPDLGTTPEAALLGLVTSSTDATARYNALIQGLELLAESLISGLDVVTFDMAAVAAAIRSDALNNGGGMYGITNVSMPCGAFAGSIGIPCDVSAFSDALHPSAAAHAIIAAAALRAVPEPTTALLVAVALVGLGWTRAARRAH